jgi:hypothetical protein
LVLAPLHSVEYGQPAGKPMLTLAAQETLQVLVPAALQMQVQPVREGALSTIVEPPVQTVPPPIGAVPPGHAQLPHSESAHD